MDTCYGGRPPATPLFPPPIEALEGADEGVLRELASREVFEAGHRKRSINLLHMRTVQSPEGRGALRQACSMSVGWVRGGRALHGQADIRCPIPPWDRKGDGKCGGIAPRRIT
jgi:hypothetical protein